MKYLIIKSIGIFYLFFYSLTSTAQIFSLNSIANLPSEISESSGLIYLNGRLITHNDSKNKAILYEINILSGNVTREIKIGNAKNVDWEDITFDSTYIYIGDFGNNKGTRMDLKIYRISIEEYFASDSVTADEINFFYYDQTDFSSRLYYHNYDAEALIAYQDNLYLFTKNWENYEMDIYKLSKKPGTYQIAKIDNIDVKGLISGATYNAYNNSILLTGYTAEDAFILELSNFNDDLFSKGTISKAMLNLKGFTQIEGITTIDNSNYFLSSEKNVLGKSMLYRLKWKSD